MACILAASCHMGDCMFSMGLTDSLTAALPGVPIMVGDAQLKEAAEAALGPELCCPDAETPKDCCI